MTRILPQIAQRLRRYRQGLLLLTGLVLALPLPVPAQVAEIYAGFSQDVFGRTGRRDQVDRFARPDFLDADYTELPADHPGHLTAVHLQRDTRCTLEALTQWQNPLTWCSLTLSRIQEAEAPAPAVYRLVSPEDSIRILFSVERPGTELLGEVAALYQSMDQPGWAEKVTRHYQENYVLRIRGGEDFNGNGRLDYREALAAASLLGDAEQWLWGIRDGSDYLAPLRNCEPALQAGILPCGPDGSSPAESPEGEEEKEEQEADEEADGDADGKGILVVPGQMGEDKTFRPLQDSEQDFERDSEREPEKETR